MEKLSLETKRIMIERFEKDNIIALATVENGMPCVRNVDAYYEDGAFYVITYALSNVVFLFVLIKPIGKKLERIKIKYGL